MTYTLFAGCSYTEGIGFQKRRDEPALWVNQLYLKHFSHTSKIHASCGGKSNQRIFQDTAKALVSMPVQYAIVQWTGVPRYEIQLGFELHNWTRVSFIPNSPMPDFNLHNTNYPGAYLSKINKRLTSLSHPAWEIIDIVSYTNTILKIAKLTNTKVFFVNGLCPWDSDFFSKKTNALPSQYTKYTQKILEVETRDNENVLDLYDKLHSHFESDGGINQSHWLNLYSSLRSNRIDTNSDGLHPGIESNNLYVDLLSKAIELRLQDL